MIAWIALAISGLAGLAAAAALVVTFTRLQRLRDGIDRAPDAADTAMQRAAQTGVAPDDRVAALAAELLAMKRVLERVAVRMEAAQDRPGRRDREADAAAAATGLRTGPSAGGALTRDLAMEVQDAVERNRVDVHLQPMVTLPQRQARFMTVRSSLRDSAGGLLPADRVAALVPRLGLAQELDNQLLLRCVQMVRRMKRRPRSVGLFCDIAADSLADADFFAQFADYLETDAELPDFLVFQIPLQAFEDADQEQLLRLRHLVDLGFRLSIDQVRSPRFSARELARGGFSFVRLDAAALLTAEVEEALEEADPDGDLDEALSGDRDWLAAYRAVAAEGLVTIVTGVEREGQVPPLVDLGVVLAEGPLFGTPRPAGSEPSA